MRAREFVFLGIRIFAVFMVIEILSMVPHFLFSILGTDAIDISALAVVIVSLLFMIGVAVVLFFRTGWLVDKIFTWVADRSYSEFDDNDDDEQEEVELESVTISQESDFSDRPSIVEDIQAIAFSVIGTWILANTIPYGGSYLIGCLGNGDGFFSTLFSTNDLSFKLTTLLNLIIGLYLFRFSLDLQKFWQGLRRAGIRNEIDKESI
jgi:hypothetical protein